MLYMRFMFTMLTFLLFTAFSLSGCINAQREIFKFKQMLNAPDAVGYMLLSAYWMRFDTARLNKFQLLIWLRSTNDTNNDTEPHINWANFSFSSRIKLIN